MDLTYQTKKYINLIDTLFNKPIYQFNYNNLDVLYEKSQKIINYIIKNFTYHIVELRKFKNKYTNLIVKLLKIGLDTDYNCSESIKLFIENIKKDKLNEIEISDFLNYNNEEIGRILEMIYNNNIDRDIKTIIGNYGNLILSKFVPYDIHKDILENLINYQSIVVKLDTNTIHFKVYYNQIDYNKMCICFVKALYIINLYNFKNLNIEIKLFLSQKEKKIGINNFLGRDEVNSGLTSFGHNTTIIIYRLEEIEKVLLHELVHLLNIDNNLIDNSGINKNINCNFNMYENSGINFFEAYTESIGFTMHLISNSILTNIDYKIILDYELKFAVIQYSKLLKFYNVENHFFSKDVCIKNTHHWIEKSSILSYYILKLGSIFNLNVFVDRYMFSKHFKSIDYYNNIVYHLDKIEPVSYIPLELKNTLRMTLYDFIWLFK